MKALGWRHVSGNIYLAVCTYACFRTVLLYVCRYVCAHVSICIHICLCMLWYDHLVSIPKLCARMHPREISAHISMQRSAHKHTQAYRYTCHTACVVFCARTTAVSISACPTEGPWPGLGLREQEGRAVVCGAPVEHCLSSVHPRPQHPGLARSPLAHSLPQQHHLGSRRSSGSSRAGPQLPASPRLALRTERGYQTQPGPPDYQGLLAPPGDQQLELRWWKGALGHSQSSKRWPLTNGRLQPNGDPSKAANDLAPLSTPPAPTPRSWTIGAGGMGGECARRWPLGGGGVAWSAVFAPTLA